VQQIIQQLVNGISAGSIYALLALGYTMVYGVLGLINFAHGEVFMVAAYVAFFTAGALGYDDMQPHGLGPLQLGMVLVSCVSVAAILGVAIERIAYRPVRGASRLAPLITAIGVSILLQNVGVLLFTSNPRSFPSIITESRMVVGGVILTNIKIVVLILAAVFMAALNYFVKHTWTGKAMRAVACSPTSARLMGISVDRTVTITFALGSALAAVGAVLFGLDQIRIEPLMGVMVGLKAFIAAVIGGIGSIHGAMAGGLLLGVIEQLSAGYLSADYRDAITFSLLIVVLVFRPRGLLGANRQEKV
jgi:branched-chain amino acid transport system permease protein